MATKEEVRVFLNSFKEKLKIWGILFLNRPKNIQSLADLEINQSQALEAVSKLEVLDYSEGPTEEVVFQGSDMWVFGKTLKGQEIYIKITMGQAGNKVLCISFHIADHPMQYPLKIKEL